MKICASLTTTINREKKQGRPHPVSLATGLKWRKGSVHERVIEGVREADFYYWWESKHMQW